ncbi:retrotransposon ty3-gypsy subclass, partial [Cystoisospora suis]
MGKRESFMPAYESELLAIVHALMKWKSFIGTKVVTVETDHATLSRILQQKHVTSRLGYWLDKLADFNINVVYKPGKQNVVADAISRRQDFIGLTEERSRGSDPSRITETEFWREQYELCADFNIPCKAVAKSSNNEQVSTPILFRQREYVWENKYLWVRTKAGWRLCVPTGSLRKTILQQFHDHILAGHPGIDRTRVAVRGSFWWPKMDRDITIFVQSCVACARGKSSHLRSGGLLQPLPIPSAPWEDTALDLIIGLPTTEDKYDAIATIVCRLTKMAHFVPTKQTAAADDIADILIKDVIRLHGVPKSIVSDRNSRFTIDVWTRLCEQLNIKRHMSTAYHPQSDGQAERTNQTTEQMLRCCLVGNETKWEKVLPLLEFAYNSTQHASANATPFELIYGFFPAKPICQQLNLPTAAALGLLPLQAAIKLQKAKQQLQKAQDYQKKYADRHRRPVLFQPGQSVRLRSTHLPLHEYAKALRPKYVGPFTIQRMEGQNAAEVELPPSWLIHPVFHVSLLRPVTTAPGHLARETRVQQPLRDEEYQIEGILNHRVTRADNRTVREFLVQGLDGVTSWIPEQDLQ